MVDITNSRNGSLENILDQRVQIHTYTKQKPEIEFTITPEDWRDCFDDMKKIDPDFKKSIRSRDMWKYPTTTPGEAVEYCSRRLKELYVENKSNNENGKLIQRVSGATGLSATLYTTTHLPHIYSAIETTTQQVLPFLSPISINQTTAGLIVGSSILVGYVAHKASGSLHNFLTQDTQKKIEGYEKIVQQIINGCRK